jgi:membrane fusion protein, multidrug efflux system
MVWEKTLEIDGTVAAVRKAEITPRIEQIILKIHAEEGDVVRKGDLLVELENETIEAALEARQVAREEAELNHRRAESLFASGAISKQQLEQAKSTAEAARAFYFESRQAAQDARITAPFSGLVSRRYQEPGELSSKIKPILTIVALDELEIHCQVSEIAIRQISPGMNARVKLDAYPGQVLDSRVKTISPTAEEASRLFQVKLSLPVNQNWLRPGMYARGEIITQTLPSAMVLPQEAVVETEAGQKAVFLICDTDHVRLQAVETGLNRDGLVEIASGLDYECRVVIQGQERLSDGARIRVVE